MTQEHLLNSEPQPTCKCNETLTINHILNNCKLHTNYHHFYFGNCNSVETYLVNDKTRNTVVIEFLKQTNFMKEI